MRRVGGLLVCSALLITAFLQWEVAPRFLDIHVRTPPWYAMFGVHSTWGGLLNMPVAMLAHLDGPHLLQNLAVLATVSLLAEPQLGSRQYVLLFVIGSAIGYTAQVAVYELVYHTSITLLGASGGAWFLLSYSAVMLRTVRIRSAELPIWFLPMLLLGYVLVEAVVLQGNSASSGHAAVVISGTGLRIIQTYG